MPLNIVEKTYHDVYPAIDPKGKLSGAASGKVVLLTGASKGIGEAIAHAFAQAGAKGLIIAARTEKDLDKVEADVKKINPKVEVLKVPTDVTSKSSVENLFKKAFDKFGEIDILINNAGILVKEGLIGESEMEKWWSVWEVNVKGTYLPSRSFLTQKSLEGKTIINTSSVGALRNRPRMSGYQSSKATVIRFTEFLNIEYGEQGLRAFAYHPGGVVTELALNMPERLHSVLVDRPTLAGGYTVWLTTPTADFLKGRYSSCTWDVDELESKKSEILEKNLLTSGVTGLTAGAGEGV